MIYYQFKSFLDKYFSFIAIIILFPIFIFIYLFIKIIDKTDPIFIQKRIGKNGKLFYLYKFKTLRDSNYYKDKDSKYTVRNTDSRITNIGFFLRISSIDEIPQFFNVLKGDMSLVGPRPSIEGHPYFASKYPKELRPRLFFKPGLTGLAQISGRNKLSNKEKYEIDIAYSKNINFWLDLKILFLTPIVLINPKVNFE